MSQLTLPFSLARQQQLCEEEEEEGRGEEGAKLSQAAATFSNRCVCVCACGRLQSECEEAALKHLGLDRRRERVRWQMGRERES